ncbi:hypothetical protein IMZ48_18915 [Candidatus Bathyarchaeota archaeon]|nr:hypothetical protein [Candidatus Bathyarchaeota archaeon]
MQDELGPVGTFPSCATLSLSTTAGAYSEQAPPTHPFHFQPPPTPSNLVFDLMPVRQSRQSQRALLAHGSTLGQLHSVASLPDWANAPVTVPKPTRGDGGVPLPVVRMEDALVAGQWMAETPVACLARPVDTGTAPPLL